MKWYSNYEHADGLYFIIEKDRQFGFYIYLYEDKQLFERDLKTTQDCFYHQDDDHQDTLESAIRVTFKNFDVPPDTWQELKIT